MSCYDELRAIFEKYPRSIFDRELKRLQRGRLAPKDREARKPLTPTQKLRLYAKQNGGCARCFDSFTVKQLTDDHTIPISKGGGNALWNRRLVCAKCNREKSDSDPLSESKRTGQSITQQLGGTPR